MLPRYLETVLCCLLALFFPGMLQGQLLPDGEEVNGSITGKVIDSKSALPVEYATITLFSVLDDKILTGTVTDKDGYFQMKDIPVGIYSVEVSFIGYGKNEIKRVLITPKSSDIKLGEIKLQETSSVLNEVNVIASKPEAAFKIDKKIIYISGDLISKGGTAADALENEPSVKTDLNGNVTLKGSSNYKVLIDGRPSALQGSDALQQIPAETIESIEMISNPSAKYDPDGEAGIVNIILKKNTQRGYSGMIGVSGGSNGKLGGNINLNRRSRKLNTTIAFNTNSDPLEFSGNMYRETYINNAILTQSFNADGTINRQGHSFNSTIEYDFNKKNNLTLQRSSGEKTLDRDLNSKYSSLTSPENTFTYFVDETGYNKSNRFKNYNLSYLHSFDYSGHSLEADVFYAKLSEDKSNTLTSRLSDDSWFIQNPPAVSQRSSEDNEEKELRFNVNYTNPFNSKIKLETGYKFERSTGIRNYKPEFFDIAQNDWIDNVALQNNLDLIENIHSGYGLISGENNKMGYKLGMRVEYFSRELTQSSPLKNYNRYFLDIFPTFHFSWKIPRDLQLQASYSKRVNHPSQEQLTPFAIYSDKQSYRMGNPVLTPEYVNSYELNLIKRVFLSFYSVQLFYKGISNKITAVRSLNPDTTMSITYQNMDNDYSLGIECSASIPFTDWWRLSVNSSIFRYDIEGDFTGQPSGNSSISMNAKLSSNFKFRRGTYIQLNAVYNGEKASAQGSQKAFLASTIAIKQDFFKGVVNATFQVRDIFNSVRFSSVSQTSAFYSTTDFKPLTPLFILSCSIRFNNYRRALQTNEMNKYEIEDLLNEQ